MSSPTPRWKGILLVTLAALLWSTGGVFIKSVSLDAFQTSAWRAFVAVIFLFLVFRPRRLYHDGATLRLSVVYAITLTLFVMATKWTTAANAIVLQYTCPIYVLILSKIWLKEPVNSVQIVALLLCIIGITLFFLDHLSPTGHLGNLCALLSGVAFAVMTVNLRRRCHHTPLDLLLWGNLWIVLAGFMIMFCQAIERNNLATAFLIPPEDIWKIAFLGVFQIALPYLLFAHALRYVRALDAALISMIEPLLNPLWVMLFVGEYPSPMAWIGGAVILSAVTAQQVYAATTSIGKALSPGG